MAVSAIDKVLGVYYELMNKTDYFSAATGLFLDYCDANGLDDDALEEEFTDKCEPEDSMFVDFDEAFPLNPPINDSSARTAEIFRIMHHCYEYGEIPNWPNYLRKRSVKTIDNAASIVAAYMHHINLSKKKIVPQTTIDLIIDILNQLNKYTVPMQKYVIKNKSNNSNFSIWNVRLHLGSNENINFEDIKKSKSFFSSMLMLIMYEIQNSNSRITTRRFEEQKNMMSNSQKIAIDDDYDDDDDDDDLNRELEHDNERLQQMKERYETDQKYDWVDAINASYRLKRHNKQDSEAKLATSNNCNFDIDLYDIIIDDLDKILGKKKISIQKNMVYMSKLGETKIFGPFSSFDELQDQEYKTRQYKSFNTIISRTKYKSFSNLKHKFFTFGDCGRKLCSFVNKWFSCNNTCHTCEATNPMEYDRSYFSVFGLLEYDNSICYIDTTENEYVLCFSFAVCHYFREHLDSANGHVLRVNGVRAWH